MSVLQVYLSWANSVLGEINSCVENVAAVQDGKVLCDIIDILAPGAGLMAKMQVSGVATQRAYIQTALDHMKNHGIKLTFSAQDILDGDIKSVLDVMWLLILHYGIHYIGESSSLRGVGNGKKALLEWCQGELEVTFDPKNTLTYSLCKGNYFNKLLQKFAGRHIDESEDKITHLHKLLQEIEERYGVKRTVVSPSDIMDATVDDHTLMIYLSLLKRRVSNTARRREMLSLEGKEIAMEKQAQERNRSASEDAHNRRRVSELVSLSQQLQQQQQQHPFRSARSASLDSSLISQGVKVTPKSRSQESVESELLSSETNSLLSGRDRSPGERGNFLLSEAEQVLKQTISDMVKEHVPGSDRDEDKDTDVSLGYSGRETESISEFSSGAFDEGYFSNRKDAAIIRPVAPTPTEGQGQTAVKRPADSEGVKKASEPGARPAKIRIKRPKDYYLQWEETIDRLSQGPPDPPDVSDMSPRSPRQILHGIEGLHSPRSRSLSSEPEVLGGSAWQRRSYVERRSGSHSPGGLGSLSPTGRGGLTAYPSTRSKSVPLLTSTSTSSRSAERSLSPSPSRSKAKHTNGSQVRQLDSTREEGRSQRSGRDSRTGERLSPIQVKTIDGSRLETSNLGSNTQFMERLEELKRSGRAQRVILPDLGPDAPVLMIPGQGEEVLLLFDALRQARLEVNLNTSNPNGTTSGTANGARSPTATSPVQTSEETDAKKIANSASAGGPASPTSPSTQEEQKQATGRLPRPTVHQHKFSKPMNNRVADLRSDRDRRRAQSLSERSHAVTGSEPSRYHSLSPKRELSKGRIPDRTEALARPRVDRFETSFRDRTDALRNRTFGGSRESLPSPLQRSYDSSPMTYSPSPPSSPFRRPTHQSTYDSPSPLRLSSPKSSPIMGRTPERPPPLELPEDLVSPRPRAGGLGRVPRREAWERQKQRKDSKPYDPDGSDSNAQAKFIEVLCKEIEQLKQKIEVMEESQAESSPERTSPIRSGPSKVTGQTGTFHTSRSEIQETKSKMLLAPRDDESPSVQRQSPGSWEAPRSGSSPRRASPQRESLSSPKRQYGQQSPSASRLHGHGSSSPTRPHTTDLSPTRRTAAEASSPSTPAGTSPQPGSADSASGGRSGRAINLGYKSPIRSVTQEIWGKDLSSVEGLAPDRKENYKKLISQHLLSEEDVIELKQSLASAVVENDILQAKLSNARHEIQDKLSKTNEVLDDCRRHLAKSQAENMELRTALEREKDRADTNESRVRDLQQIVQQARSDNDELEEELDHTLSILDRSKPGIDALKQQNAKLHGKASVVLNENSTLKREMDDLRKSHFKSVNTIRELRSLLDEVRAERNELQHQLGKLQHQQNESKVKSILTHYNQEKGAKDESEREYATTGVSVTSERLRPPSQGHRPASRGEEVTPRSPPASKPARSSSPGRGMNYSYEEMSPTVPSTYREIYPHRKPRYQGMSTEMYGSPDGQDSPVDFIDYPDLQHFPTKLDHMDAGDDYLNEDDKVVSYTKPRTRDNSPILKPVPYRPYLDDSKLSIYSMMDDRGTESARENRARSPQTRGRSPARTSQRMKGSCSTSPSPARGLSSDRLNRSYDSAMFGRQQQRCASSSPGRRGEGRKGILKNTTFAGRIADRSCSPRYSSRSHSPPTRLSPEEKKQGLASKKKLMFARTKAGQIARDLQREFDKEDFLLNGLRKKHSSKSWFELQLEEHLLLSEEQRSYANELIKKYTGLKL